MQIRINRGELLTELAPMQGIVERKSTIPVLSHLLLRAQDGRLHLAATDLDVSLRSWCDAEVLAEGAIAIQARKFLEIVRALNGDTVELTLEDQGGLKIVAGSSRFKINGLASEDFPSLPSVEADDGFRLAYSDFRRMISKIIFAVSAEESRFQLNGALLRIKNDAIEMVATDGHRLALIESQHEGAVDAEGVLVPRKALQELLRFDSEEEVVFRRGEHHLAFEIGRRELTCRILEGTFPDYDKVIAKDNDRKISFERKTLAEVVQRVALLTGDRARAVRMQFGDQQLTVSAANPDLGEAEETLGCEYSGPDFQVGLNPDYVGQFLSVVDTEQVLLELKDENSQCVGHPIEGPDSRYLCVIMPMRI